MLDAPLLSVRDLKVHFRLRRSLLAREAPSVKAVDGISFDLHAGETLGIVGESGCGKSTLGRAILRLVRASGGEVRWQGQNVLSLPAEDLRRIRRHMQIIFQDPLAALDPRMTIHEIVSRPLRVFQPELGRKARYRRAAQVLEQVGLGSFALNRYPHEFSGGQCQRIGIARAIIMQPKLLICDEPVSALDVSIQAQVINLLAALQKDLNIALIFISHNLSVVRHLSHRILVLYLGKAAELSSREALFAAPAHPYTQALISAVPLPDPERERQRQPVTLKGDIPSPLFPPSGCRFRTRCPRGQELCALKEPDFRAIELGHFAACHFA